MFPIKCRYYGGMDDGMQIADGTSWFVLPVGAITILNGVICVKTPELPDGSGEALWRVVPKIQAYIPGWTIHGSVDNIETFTIAPSIFINPPTGFHGWLRNGELILA